MLTPRLLARRILVTGNAGSGKSTLAAVLGQRLGLPVIGLDRIVWQPGWRKTPKEERREALRSITAQAEWIVDGVSTEILAAADMVVFLDVSRPVCIWRCFWRNLPYLFRSRPGLPERCPEILIAPALVRLIWRFSAQVRPGIVEMLGAGGPGKVSVHIRTEGELREFQAGFTAP